MAITQDKLWGLIDMKSWKATPCVSGRLVCMDGFDLSGMLRLRRHFSDIMEAKVRRAAETGSPFVPVRDLFVS